MAIEPLIYRWSGNVLGVLGPLEFSGHFLTDFLTYFIYIPCNFLDWKDLSMFNYL